MEVTPVHLHKTKEAVKSHEDTENTHQTRIDEDLEDDYDPESIGELVAPLDGPNGQMAKAGADNSGNQKIEDDRFDENPLNVVPANPQESHVEEPVEDAKPEDQNTSAKTGEETATGATLEAGVLNSFPGSVSEDEDRSVAEEVERDDIQQSAMPPVERDTSEPGDVQVESEEDDEYDPLILGQGVEDEEAAKSDKEAASLPPKPQMQLDQPMQLKDAYEAIMKSDVVQRPEFLQLSQEEQMTIIQQLLEQKNIALPQQIQPSIDPDMNYAQVHSFNKPFKYVNDPIPLVPVNKYCRRPDITLPPTAEEESAYARFLEVQDLMGGPDEPKFPENLRLFIGNFPANTISKQDLFRILRPYGEVVQISVKGGYAFVQFRTAEACAECIKGETGVPLHNRYLRLAPSLRNKKPTVRGREREEGETEYEAESKKQHISPDCQILITNDAVPHFVEELESVFQEAGIAYATSEIGDKDSADVICEAAYLGVIAACVIKDNKIDVQTFEETLDGGIRFDEYESVKPDVAIDIIKKKKAQTDQEQRQQEDELSKTKDSRSESRNVNSRTDRSREEGRERSFGHINRSDNLHRGRQNPRPRNGGRGDYQSYGHPQSGFSNSHSNYQKGFDDSYNPQQTYGQNHRDRHSYRGGQWFNQNHHDRPPSRGTNPNFEPNFSPPQGYGNSSNYGNSNHGNTNYGNNNYGNNNYGNNNYGDKNYGNNNYGNNSNYGDTNYDNNSNYGNKNYGNNSNYGRDSYGNNSNNRSSSNYGNISSNGPRSHGLNIYLASSYFQLPHLNGQNGSQPGFHPSQDPSHFSLPSGQFNPQTNIQQITPEVLQTLQNLDPLTAQTVVSMLQQNTAPNSQQSYCRPNQMAPVNTMAQPNPNYNQTPPNQSYSTPSSRNYNYGPQPTYNDYVHIQGQNKQQSQQQPKQPQNSALMDMLARLGNP